MNIVSTNRDDLYALVLQSHHVRILLNVVLGNAVWCDGLHRPMDD